MKISGFTFLRNASKLYYPVKESLLSLLPLVDELVIAVGDNDPDDTIYEIIRSIGSPKIKTIDTVWDVEQYPSGTEYAHQTDLAKAACTGDWLFYLQGDEVVHEKDYDAIRKACEQHYADPEVEGLLFRYLHFFGDYQHYFRDHTWYPYEIRIVRNDPEIHAYRDAQSFRRIPDFDGKSYHAKEGTSKLQVAKVDADVFHYGWVRPPKDMVRKRKSFDTHTKSDEYVKTTYQKFQEAFDYGRLDRARVFKGTHPAVMEAKIQEHDWSDQLRFSGPTAIGRPIMKHEKPKYRFINAFERIFLGGRRVGGFKNYKIVRS